MKYVPKSKFDSLGIQTLAIIISLTYIHVLHLNNIFMQHMS